MNLTDYDTPTPTGDELLDEVHAALTRYVILPSDAAETATVLWLVCTHAVPAFEHATRLAIHSAVKRCGKSRLLEVLKALVYNPLSTTDISVAALFRVIAAADDHPPTLLLDEADRLFGSAKKDDDNRELIALINNGFRAGSPTWRCVGPQQTPTEFSNYAMIALAGIGRKPDTIEDRAVNITLRRRLPSETVSKLRQRTDLPVLHEVRDRVAVWADANLAALGVEVDDIPDELEDRAQDAWEPLLAIADVAGGAWPKRARDAAKQLCKEVSETEEVSPDLRMLADVRDVFAFDAAVDFISTARLLELLISLEDSPWSERDRGGHPFLTSRKVASRLVKFGVKPRHNRDKTVRGYWLQDCSDAFGRYLLQAGVPSEPSKASGTPSDLGKQSDGSQNSSVRDSSSDAGRISDGSEKQSVHAKTAGQGHDQTGRTVRTEPPLGQVPPIRRADDWSQPPADVPTGNCTICDKPAVRRDLNGSALCSSCYEAYGTKTTTRTDTA